MDEEVGERGGRMRKHNYLVGYQGEGQCVYGKEEEGRGFVDPLTLLQAKRLVKKIVTLTRRGKIKSVVYKLVEIKNE